MIIPNVQVEFLHTVVVLGRIEEPAVAVLLLVLLVDVYCQDHRASCNNRGLVVQKPCVVQLELANLESHIPYCLVCVIAEDPQEPLHRLDGAREVEVEAHLDKDLGLQLYERLFAHILFLLVGKKIYHPGKAGRNRLLELCRHQNANGGEGDHLRLGEVLSPHQADVSVEDAGGYEQGLWLVLFLYV